MSALTNLPMNGRLLAQLEQDLRATVKAALPDHMQPAAYVMLSAFPLTSNGKLDRSLLPPPDGVIALDNFVPPRTPIEEAVADVWAGMLGVEQVGVHENFFALGGHSLLATRVIAQIRALLEVDVTLRMLFERPTVGEFAEGLVKIFEAEIAQSAHENV